MHRSTVALVLLLVPLAACGPRDPAEWARAQAKPLASVEPGGTGEDLEPLGALVGEARVVALGQPTYGTHETLQAARRITEFLTAEKGFSVVALETGANEARRIDAWVQGGAEEGRQALATTLEWSLESQEMLEFLRGLRERNASGASVRVRGFGLTQTRASLDAVRGVLTSLDPTKLPDLDAAYEAVAFATGQDAPRAEVAFSAGALVGKQVRSSGFIKTQEVTGGTARLSWQALDAAGTELLSVPMEGERPTGTTGWIRYDLRMRVPEGTQRIRIAMILAGNGTAWFDGLHLLADNTPYAWDIDLDFESEGGAQGLTLHGLDPKSGITREESKAGKASLELVADLAAFRARGLELLPAASGSAGQIRTFLESRREDLPQGVTEQDLDWALDAARGMEQVLDVIGAGSVEQSDALPAATLDPVKEARARALAENVQRIVERSSAQDRILVWTHNLHASQRKGRMGSLLAAKYGDSYLALGSAFREGAYRGFGPRGLGEQAAARAPEDSVETRLHGTGLASFLLDLRATPEPWLKQPRPFRAIGARASAEQFHAAAVAEEFDLLLYVDRTTASRAVGN